MAGSYPHAGTACPLPECSLRLVQRVRGPRLRRRLLLHLALLSGCEIVPTYGQKSWRLVCNSSTSEEWRLCSVGFFSDLGCTVVPPLQGQLSSPARSVSIGSTSDLAFLDWGSACDACQAGEAYIGVRFSTPSVVRCVRYGACSDDTTTLAPTTTARATTTRGAGGSPSPAPTPAPPGGSTATTLTAVTTTNPFDGLFNGIPRRLWSGRCGQLVLQRLDTSFWVSVFAWQDAHPLDLLNKDRSTYFNPLSQPPDVLAWNPPAGSCGRCGVNGLKPMGHLEVTFTEAVFPADGGIRLTRGGLPDLVVPMTSASWFRFNGSTLTVLPQSPLGQSSSCGHLLFDACAVVDADGNCYSDLDGGYTYCMADVLPPNLMVSEPPDGGVALNLLPRLQLGFDEAIVMASSPGTAYLSVVSGGSPGVISIDLGGSQVKTYVWNVATGATQVEITLARALQAETSYRLDVPAAAVLDLAGNPWAGGQISFITPCDASGCRATTSTTSLAPGGGSTVAKESQPIGLYLGIVGAVLFVGGMAILCWWRYLRRLFRSEDNEEDGAKVAPSPDPARAEAGLYGRTQTGWANVAKSEGTGWAQRPGSTSPSTPAASQGPRQAAWTQPASPTTASPTLQTEGGARPRAQRQRSREAEDLPSAGTTRTGTAHTPNGVRPGPFTEESASGGGWVRQIDKASGRPFWMHYKTRETRWEPPPKSGASAKARQPTEQPDAGANDTGGARPGAAPQQKASMPASNKVGGSPPGNTASEPPDETARVTAEVSAQLEKTIKEDLASRKKTFKFLCLKWHPDKNQDSNPELATQIFQYLQTQKDWYLKE